MWYCGSDDFCSALMMRSFFWSLVQVLGLQNVDRMTQSSRVQAASFLLSIQFLSILLTSQNSSNTCFGVL